MLGTDGLFDNLFDKDIAECIRKELSGEKMDILDVNAAADCLANKAQKLGKDEDYESPFALNAKEVGMDGKGGKEDDITVIVAQIQHKDKADKEDKVVQIKKGEETKYADKESKELLAAAMKHLDGNDEEHLDLADIDDLEVLLEKAGDGLTMDDIDEMLAAEKEELPEEEEEFPEDPDGE